MIWSILTTVFACGQKATAVLFCPNTIFFNATHFLRRIPILPKAALAIWRGSDFSKNGALSFQSTIRFIARICGLWAIAQSINSMWNCQKKLWHRVSPRVSSVHSGAARYSPSKLISVRTGTSIAASFSRPPRSGRSITKLAPTTSAPAWRTS